MCHGSAFNMLASPFVVLLVSSAAALAAGNPTFPTRYHVKGSIILPSGQIIEPYEAWVDLTKGSSRIDYHGGELGKGGVLYSLLWCFVLTPVSLSGSAIV